MYDELGLRKYEETIHSPEELREAYRWNTGDWGYQGTAQDGEHLFRDDWEKLWSPLQNELHGRIVEELGMDSRPWTDRFVEMLYRVLFRLEEEGAFRELRKTPDFRTVILDHDEPDDWPWKRMENMRRKLQHTWPPHQRLT
jgi:hypothetical protein